MITLDDLVLRFGEQEIAELSDKNGDYGYKEINLNVVNKAIFDAESEVESYLNAVGLVSRNAESQLLYVQSHIPTALIIKTCDIARYYLYDNGVTEIVKQRYEQAITWLKLVMKNPTMLTGVYGDTAQNTHGGIVVKPNIMPNIWRD